MKVFKKLSFLLVGLPLFFGLMTLFSDSVSAQTTTCANGVSISSPTSVQKLGSSTKFTVRVTNLSQQNTCTYVPFVSSGPNVTGWNFKFATSTTATPQSTINLPVSSENFKNLVVVATPPSSWFNNPSKIEFRLRLKFNGNQLVPFKDIPYSAGYACNNKASLTATNINGSGDNKSRTYELKLLNNDESGCPATRYSLSTVTPNNSTWNTTYLTSAGASLGTTNITRNPGQPLNFKIKVVPPSGAAAGDKLIRVSATDTSRQSVTRELNYKISADNSRIACGKNASGGNVAGERCIASNLRAECSGTEGTIVSGKACGTNQLCCKFSTPTTPAPTGCQNNAPIFDVIPNQREGKPGAVKSYELKITNKDTKGSSCGDNTVFEAKVEAIGKPNSNWVIQFENNGSVSVPRNNGTKNIGFTIKSPTGANPDKKTITLTVKRKGATKEFHPVAYYKVLPDQTPITSGAPTRRPTAADTPTNTPTRRQEPTQGPTPTSCVRKDPILTVDPESIRSLPGSTVAYEVKVKNIDEGPCADRKLTLLRKLPNNDWTGNWSSDTTDFNIAKNVEKKFTLKIKSPNSANNGRKEITVNLKNSNDQTVKTKKITYEVSTSTPTPTNPPDQPTATPTHGADTSSLNFILGVDGIGTTPRVPLGGNKNPNDQFRQLNFKIYSAADNTLKYEVGNFPFTYNQDSEKFQTVYDFPADTNVTDGTYNVYVEGSPFLVTQYPGSVTIKKGEVTNLTSPNFYMITGNINNSDQSQNKLDILDYNVLISCSIFAKSTELCDSNENFSKWSDLNNNGVVDQDDYTLWLKEFANQQGAQLPN